MACVLGFLSALLNLTGFDILSNLFGCLLEITKS